MLENVYEGLNTQPKVYLLKEYFCEMYPTCVSSKLCEFILISTLSINPNLDLCYQLYRKCEIWAFPLALCCLN